MDYETKRSQIVKYLSDMDRSKLLMVATDALEYLVSIDHATINDKDQVCWPSCGDVIGDI